LILLARALLRKFFELRPKMGISYDLHINRYAIAY
jgi:hypothetical protein